jgi:hypothetical protein
MAEVAERKFKGDSVQLVLWRDRAKKEVTVPLTHAWPFSMQSNQFDVLPAYVLYGGLLFQPLSRNLLGSVQFQNPRLSYLFEAFVPRELYKDHPEVIVLSAILADPTNTYFSEFKDGVLEEINGTPVRTLADVAAAFGKPGEFHVLKFMGNGRPLVLERSVVDSARERIRSRYGVRQEQFLETAAR